MADFLLHSMSEFKPIFDEAMRLRQPKKMVEIGSEYAGSTKVILDYAKASGAHLTVIDPAPYVDLAEVLSPYVGHFDLLKELSVNALPKLHDIDMFFVDGDHNYYTVWHELIYIYQNNPSAWVFLHDVAWPCAYRDLYYNPSAIPTEYLHEYTYTDGVGADNQLIKNGGFHGAGLYSWAVKHGGERNGVKKAIEDFLSQQPQLFYNQINAVMGLGLIVPMQDKALSCQLMQPYQNSLLDSMEKNRIELYLRVLELQDMTVGKKIIKKAKSIMGK